MTKPTRAQQQARTMLAQAILGISEAARLDGTPKFNSALLREIAERAAKATSAFSLDEIVATALEMRLTAMGLPAGSVELLTLIEQSKTPVEMIHLGVEELKQLVIEAEAELG